MLFVSIIALVFCYFFIMFMIDLDKTDGDIYIPPVQEDNKVVEPDDVPAEPTFKDYLDEIKIRLYIPAVYIDEPTQIQYMLQRVKVNIPETSKVISLKMEVHYLDRERNRLVDMYNSNKSYSTIDCTKGCFEYEVMEFSNTNCVLSEYKVVSITLENGTVMLPDPEPEEWW